MDHKVVLFFHIETEPNKYHKLRHDEVICTLRQPFRKHSASILILVSSNDQWYFPLAFQ